MAGMRRLMLLTLLGATAVHGEGFGRWETRLQECSLQQGLVGLPLQAQRQTCIRLRLEQNMEGLLSVRLIQPSSSQRFGSQTLVFGGVLVPGHRPMRCNPEGKCQPRWPIQLDVGTVASSLIPDQGQSPTLPTAVLAKGRCRLERHQLHCQAQDQGGRFWEAKATL